MAKHKKEEEKENKLVKQHQKSSPTYDRLKQIDMSEESHTGYALSAKGTTSLINGTGRPNSISSEDVLYLQQTYGNQYVQNLFKDNKKTNSGKDSPGTRLASGGKPLEPGTRASMEAAFGKDFSAVQVDEEDRVSELKGNLAMTTGETIHFSPGKYETQTETGRQMLGHELAHVVQQTKGGEAIASDEALENEARKASYEVSVGQQVSILGSAIFGQSQGIPPGAVSPQAITRTVPEPTTVIASAIKSGDPDAIYTLPAEQILGASIPDRLALVGLLLRRSWLGRQMTPKGITDNIMITMIWGSFPGKVLSEILEKKENFQLWNKCVERGAELDKLEAIKNIKSSIEGHFKKDVKATAQCYLDQNYVYASNELKSVGGESGVSTADQIARISHLRVAASQVQRALKEQDKCRRVVVGWNRPPMQSKSGLDVEVSFDPDKKPDWGHDNPPFPKKKVAYMSSWNSIHEKYKEMTEVIEFYTTKYPTIYGFLKDNRIDELVAARDVEEAAAMIRGTLRGLQNNILFAKLKLEQDKLDYRDLWPIHDQLYRGKSPAANIVVDWQKPLAQWIGREVVKGHEKTEFWLTLGLSTLSAALFILASITTGGAASVFFVAGSAVSATQPIMSWEKYMDLARASKLDLRKELAMVSDEQVKAKLIESLILSAGTFLDVCLAAKGIAAGAKAATAGAEKEAVAGTRVAGEAATAGAEKEAVAGTRVAGEAAPVAAGAEAGPLKRVPDVEMKLPVVKEGAKAIGEAGGKVTGFFDPIQAKELASKIRGTKIEVGAWNYSGKSQFAEYLAILREKWPDLWKGHATTSGFYLAEDIVSPFGGRVTKGIYINITAENATTFMHELLHHISRGREVRAVFGEMFDEGLTQYFAQHYTKTQVIMSYPGYVRVVKQVINKVGTDIVEKAYFKGDVGLLYRALEKTFKDETVFKAFIDKCKLEGEAAAKEVLAWLG